MPERYGTKKKNPPKNNSQPATQFSTKTTTTSSTCSGLAVGVCGTRFAGASTIIATKRPTGGQNQRTTHGEKEKPKQTRQRHSMWRKLGMLLLLWWLRGGFSALSVTVKRIFRSAVARRARLFIASAYRVLRRVCCCAARQ